MDTLMQRINNKEFDGGKNWEERDEKKKSFKKAFLEELGVPEDHVKADRLFEICWEECHSSGFREVFNFGIDLVDLLTLE